MGQAKYFNENSCWGTACRSRDFQVKGEAVSFRSVNDAMKRGIALIHQELNL